MTPEKGWGGEGGGSRKSWKLGKQGGIEKPLISFLFFVCNQKPTGEFVVACQVY